MDEALLPQKTAESLFINANPSSSLWHRENIMWSHLTGTALFFIQTSLNFRKSCENIIQGLGIRGHTRSTPEGREVNLPLGEPDDAHELQGIAHLVEDLHTPGTLST